MIALQEVERYYIRSGTVDQAAELAALLPDHHWVYGPGLDVDASVARPRGAAGPPPPPVREHAAFARRPSSPPAASRCPSSAPCPLQPPAGRPGGRDLRGSGLPAPRCACTRSISPTSPTRRAGPRSRRSSTSTGARPRKAARGAAPTPERSGRQDEPAPPMPRDALLMGDFNSIPPPRSTTASSGPLSPEYGRMTAIEGFVDAWVATGHGEREGITCPGRPPRPANRLLLRQHAPPAAAPRCWIDDAAAGSDHQPVWTELDL